MAIELEKFTDQGMYLRLPSGKILDFSLSRVHRLAEEYWENPEKLPKEIRAHDSFLTCEICPYRGQQVLCSAVKPLFPFLEELEEFISCDQVTAIYVDNAALMHISQTTMSNALQYITNISIFEYCEDMKQYRVYFKGLMPFQSIEECACVLFLNIFWLNGGDLEKAKKICEEICQVIALTSENCVKRLHLICKSDVFLNAYVKTHTLSGYLGKHIDVLIKEHFGGA